MKKNIITVLPYVFIKSNPVEQTQEKGDSLEKPRALKKNK